MQTSSNVDVSSRSINQSAATGRDETSEGFSVTGDVIETVDIGVSERERSNASADITSDKLTNATFRKSERVQQRPSSDYKPCVTLELNLKWNHQNAKNSEKFINNLLS